LAWALAFGLAAPACAVAGDLSPAAGAAADRLIAAYPDFLLRRDGNRLVWRDGETMPIDDGIAGKSPDQRLNAPDLKDQFATPYIPGPPAAVQPVPARANARHAAHTRARGCRLTCAPPRDAVPT